VGVLADVALLRAGRIVDRVARAAPRGYRTISAANPGIPDGGIVGESKFDILSRLPQEWTIASALVAGGPLDARVETLVSCVRERGWSFPLVLKPDIGQRGSGVRLVRSLADATEYLRRMRGPVVASRIIQGRTRQASSTTGCRARATGGSCRSPTSISGRDW